jgi:hypothetical protein
MTAGFQSGWIATEIHNIEEMVGSIPTWSIVPALCTSRRRSGRSKGTTSKNLYPHPGKFLNLSARMYFIVFKSKSRKNGAAHP